MFLETIIVESPLDIIKAFANPIFIYGIFIIFVAWLMLYSGKNPKVKPVAYALAAILFIISIIVYIKFG